MPTSYSEADRVTRGRGIVSVVITCYNHARYLAEAIESALAQTYRSIDVVVIDDGSTDATSQVVRHYPRARYVRLPNVGVARARNRGFHESGGEYVVFLDGDDRLRPGALQTQLDALAARPEAAFAVGRHAFIGADGSLLDWATDAVVHGDQYRELLLNNYITMPGMVMHRRACMEALAPNGFSTAADHSSDYELYLRIARQRPIARHDAVVAEYRVHDANTSHKAAVMLRGTMTVHRAQWRYVKRRPDYREAYRRGSFKWQERYGTQVLASVREHLARGGWDGRRHAFHGLLTLLRYSPRVLARSALRKVRNTARRLSHGRDRLADR